MKHSIAYVVARFPKVELAWKKKEQLDTLSNLERVMYDLCLYFENPSEHSFDLKEVYALRDGGWIAFVLEAIRIFFERDTYLLAGESLPPMNKEEKGPAYLNQSNFARYLQDQGLPYSQSKLAVYRKRGKLPKEDLIFDGRPYWLETTARRFAEEQQK